MTLEEKLTEIKRHGDDNGFRGKLRILTESDVQLTRHRASTALLHKLRKRSVYIVQCMLSLKQPGCYDSWLFLFNNRTELLLPAKKRSFLSNWNSDSQQGNSWEVDEIGRSISIMIRFAVNAFKWPISGPWWPVCVLSKLLSKMFQCNKQLIIDYHSTESEPDTTYERIINMPEKRISQYPWPEVHKHVLNWPPENFNRWPEHVKKWILSPLALNMLVKETDLYKS